MKRIIRPKEFPIEMNQENIEILAMMQLNFPPPIKYPPPVEYLKLLHLDLLSHDDQIKINGKVDKIKEEEKKLRWESLTKEEQEEEKGKIKKSLQEGPNVYRGNLLQQEWDSMNLEKIVRENRGKENE